MGRIAAQFVLPIVLPSVLYFLWLTAERRRVERAGTGDKPRWQDAPWIWLVALGILFAGLISVGLALLGGDDIKGTYVPPRLIDGVVVPGHVDPKP